MSKKTQPIIIGFWLILVRWYINKGDHAKHFLKNTNDYTYLLTKFIMTKRFTIQTIDPKISQRKVTLLRM